MLRSKELRAFNNYVQNTSVFDTYKMRYSLEPSYRMYVHGHGFMSFAKI